jgi:2'-5' RNA ligase
VVADLRRVFAAAPVPDEVRLALTDQLSGLDLPGRVAPKENWHLTLRFLGHIDEVTCERFVGALSTSDLGAPFKISLAGLGAFPRTSRATVLWIGVDMGAAGLANLAAVCEEAAQDAGLDPEDRPFHPHLTLSRIRPPVNVESRVTEYRSKGLSWRCDAIVVYESHPGRGGVHYEPLETMPLVG